MKKLASYVTVFILIIQTVCAASVQTVPTDIRVFTDGKEIPSVCMRNEMYIAADDLIYFGYNLKYDENIRTLFLNKTAEPSNEKAPKDEVTSLEKTDIRLVINGRTAETELYAANGKLYVSASYLSYERDGGDLNQPEKGNYFGMEHRWDGEKRVLEISSIKLPAKEEQIAEFIDPTDKFSWSEIGRWNGTFFDVVKCAQSGTTHGTYTHTKYFANNGVSADLNSAYSLYGFYDYWGHTTVQNEELKDDKLYFDGTKTDGRTGRYFLDCKTLAIITIEETEPDDSKRTIPKYESPISTIPQKASFKTVMDGVEIPVWVILNTASYIDADLLLNFGYEKTYLNNRTVSYVKTGKVTTYNAPDVTEPVHSSASPIVYIDGDSVATLNAGNINLISTEVWTRFFSESSISAVWDAENNTLVINTNNKMFETYEEAEKYAREYYNIDDGNEKIIYNGADFSIMICPYNSGMEIFKINSDYSVCCISRLLCEIYLLTLEKNDTANVSSDGRTLEFESGGASYCLDLYNYTLKNR